MSAPEAEQTAGEGKLPGTPLSPSLVRIWSLEAALQAMMSQAEWAAAPNLRNCQESQHPLPIKSAHL